MKHMERMDTLKRDEAIISVVGLGYVGLPLAYEFSKSLQVVGFDVDGAKIRELNSNQNTDILFTDDPRDIRDSDFVVIAVHTPVTRSKIPDLSYVEDASRMVGENLKKGSIVILESTVYPGVTEEVMKPILEQRSGLRCGQDFQIAYSPERINPGDDEHTLSAIIKVVGGMDDETTEVVAELYRKVAPEVFKAKDIKTAEAAKVIENIQRDINIALMNELALIFGRMGLNLRDVIAAAATKWNFAEYYPGLVGGHCIPVDPYYLVYKAEELGYHPEVILAGRAINDYMPKYVAELAVKGLNTSGRVIRNSRVLILGLTYKENVKDTRETPVKEVIRELREYGIEVFGHDPLLRDELIEREFGIKGGNLKIGADCVILTVCHDIFKEITLDELRDGMNEDPVLIDVRGFFDEEKAIEKGFCYKSL